MIGFTQISSSVSSSHSPAFSIVLDIIYLEDIMFSKENGKVWIPFSAKKKFFSNEKCVNLSCQSSQISFKIYAYHCHFILHIIIFLFFIKFFLISHIFLNFWCFTIKWKKSWMVLALVLKMKKWNLFKNENKSL